MRHARLGRTALRVSRLCLGTLDFGVRTTRPGSFRPMGEALNEEINFFDTADEYGRQARRWPWWGGRIKFHGHGEGAVH
ncbi:hypothetical protein [Sinosporangium siamense]|uniref:NADP-dependent oxidoreductase domain-containing protein n=1 Tax=Sinosporangium siamense TaxID=1367973 RepID=A0A919VD43_9ACTN|nr:hypothetical protein [Sinosporangium siamense]GII93754.1 hypothetical protein Ssi02_39850 [Sinosporangium siamense]